MDKILAHHVIFQGKDYGFSVAEISDDRSSVTITPYEREISNTIFHSGILVIASDDAGLLTAQFLSH